jgi:hypothetical protein
MSMSVGELILLSKARKSWLQPTIGGQGAPSERSVAVARTTARSLELVTLHLDGPPHVLDTLGSAAGLPNQDNRRQSSTLEICYGCHSRNVSITMRTI